MPALCKFVNIYVATLFHKPFRLWASVAFHYSSDPCPRNDQCPRGNFLAFSATSEELRSQHSSLPIWPPIDVAVHRREDDSIPEIFWLNVIFLHHVLGFPQARFRRSL